MIKVTDNKENTIYYKCDCGTKGMCTVKPMDRDAALVIDVCCPKCDAKERMVLMQYSSEDKKEHLEEAVKDMELSWGMTLNNKELEEEE